MPFKNYDIEFLIVRYLELYFSLVLGLKLLQLVRGLSRLLGEFFLKIYDFDLSYCPWKKSALIFESKIYFKKYFIKQLGTLSTVGDDG